MLLGEAVLVDVFRVRDRLVWDYEEFVRGFLTIADSALPVHVESTVA
ncbi:hypothetical protein FDG2_1082 [Candidatus Protofrankia californiensis]|uniref:Uncharacterized protein n=1 Tax=Candidatus Protofrankia californiensis TaxID=1839754 RepID=A0A1C3NUT6_9ACTN|nr:hypothetical protein FDG2_1082 [Candidatus Protofrankia californiensis]